MKRIASLYVLSSKQIGFGSLLIAIVSASAVFLANVLIAYHELPEVHKDSGNCVKVVNMKNGDAYTCADVDVTLRKYHTVK